MKDSATIQRAYTDSPWQSPNLILGSLQLLLWIVMHPTALRNHIIQIDKNLSPEFCLLDLDFSQWKNPILRRLLLQSFLVLPLLTSYIFSLLLLIFSSYRVSDYPTILAWLLLIGFTVNFLASVTFSVINGLVAGVAAVGLYFSMSALGNTTGGIEIVAAAAGLILGSWGSVNKPRKNYSLVRQIGAVIAGIIITDVLLISRDHFFEYLIDLIGEDPIESIIYAASYGGIIGLSGYIRSRKYWYLPFGIVFGVWIWLIEVLIGDFLIAWLFIFLSVYSLPYAIAKLLGGSSAGSVSGALCGVPMLTDFLVENQGQEIWINELRIYYLTLGFIFMGITNSYWLSTCLYPFMNIWNAIIFFVDKYFATKSFSLLRFHSAFWDEFQQLKLFGLDRHIALTLRKKPSEARAAIEYLSTSRQRWAAGAIQIELDISHLEKLQTIEALAKFAKSSDISLSSTNPRLQIFQIFQSLSIDISAALSQTSYYNQRLALAKISEDISRLVLSLTRTDNKYAPRFYPIAQNWQTIVVQYCNLLEKEAEQNQDLDNPYVTGVPLQKSQYVFVGRTGSSSRIEQLLLDDRRPPLLLYGQRRTGKTSLLNNLGRLLPTRFIPTAVDLQGPTSKARNPSGFLYNLARDISKTALYQRNLQLPALTREALDNDPFTIFDEWLDEVEERIDERFHNGTLLLTLDEFEALDAALVANRFNEQDILGTLRNIIQHRPRIKVMIAGSHTLQEFHRWASYLINVQVIHLSYLKESEARQLIEHPTPDFALRYEPDAVQRIIHLTRCQPYLVQLLCAELVVHKNEQDPSIRRLALRVDVEAVIELAIDSGSFFFADIQNNQMDATGLAVLRAIAAAGEGVGVSREELERHFGDELSAAISQLQQRELIEPNGDGYKFQVEMIRLWFAREMVP